MKTTVTEASARLEALKNSLPPEEDPLHRAAASRGRSEHDALATVVSIRQGLEGVRFGYQAFFPCRPIDQQKVRKQVQDIARQEGQAIAMRWDKDGWWVTPAPTNRKGKRRASR